MPARASAFIALLSVLALAPGARAGYDRSFDAGSLIIPMDLAYQDEGLLQAYGLVFQLLRQGVPVYWVIDPEKAWHDAPCDTPGDECPWDCADEGSGPCPYPTASPDFEASAEVVWDGEGLSSPGDAIARHGYRGGPFVIDAADQDAALAIVEAWNDQSLWAESAWATRSVFHVVTVHQATVSFDAYVRKEMIAAPTIAVFSDGNEDIATSYLRAAGIPQSNGSEFPERRCGADDCGPGTDNPDMLTVVSIMGDMGTCDAPITDHRNGALFSADGVPAYCQIMSMHWAVNDRETVECDGGACPATREECAGATFTYHGHEVVAEVRQFLQFPTHFFAECQAVNAYENTVPDPSWPFLDDPERRGHFLTTTGTPPDCPCTDGDFECVPAGCDDGVRDCCLPREPKELGAGFLIAARPDAATIQILNPQIPYNQLDGAFETVGGSEPAYNLSDYLGTEYINDRDVTFITGPDGPGDQDVWMTGYVDGTCDIGHDEFAPSPDDCNLGKVSYLGGHSYDTAVPVSAHPGSQGARLFLNALFEADCVTTAGQPDLLVTWSGPASLPSDVLPAEGRYTVGFANGGLGAALDATLTVTLPADVEAADEEEGASVAGSEISWPLGSIGGAGTSAGPAAAGSRWADLRFAVEGEHVLEAVLAYRVGASTLRTAPATFTVVVSPDSDGDTVPDAVDPDPDDAHVCGDSDGDGCDDCAVAGRPEPDNDGPDQDGDGLCDDGGGGDGGAGGGGESGCSCRAGGAGPTGGWTALPSAWLRIGRRASGQR